MNKSGLIILAARRFLQQQQAHLAEIGSKGDKVRTLMHQLTEITILSLVLYTYPVSSQTHFLPELA